MTHIMRLSKHAIAQASLVLFAGKCVEIKGGTK
jgi:hypothetical protein